MPDLYPNPVPPGTVPADRLDAVERLHAVCRAWSADTPVHQPYNDLLFAFGFATLGAPDRARRLLASARDAMREPLPAQLPAPFHAAVPVVADLAFRMFEFRVEQAAAGNPPAGPLPVEVLAEFDAILSRATGSPPADTDPWVWHATAVLRRASRTLDPGTEVDPFVPWGSSPQNRRQSLPAGDGNIPDPTPITPDGAGAARLELLRTDGPPLRPRDYVALARGYMAVTVHEPPDIGLSELTRFFGDMPPGRVMNMFTTASYFSRWHLALTEDVVEAACRMLLAPS